MPKPIRRALAAGAAVLLVSLTLVALGPASPAGAANTAPFTAAFRANANGAIVTVGNNLMTCPAGSSSGGVSCASARAGGVADDNGFTMTNLDADSDASTFNSSSSTLALPAGASVQWAGLYWGARLDAGVGGQPGSGTRTQMQLKVPGAANYQTVSIGAFAGQEFGPNTTSNNAYQEFANITGLVKAAGNGAYWGANVVAGTGQDRYAGWAMTVVYTAPGLPLRNLTVFQGFNVVGAGTPQNIAISGFQAPLAGTVDAQLTMVAYEGDLSQTGDYTRLNNTQLATALSPGSNFFDSANDVNGTSVTTRTPADKNMLGFDIKNLGASGAIGNGATSATFTFSSNGDVYYPGVVGLAINLYAPDFTASSKTVVDLNGNSPARPGDTLQYTLNYANTGQDPAVNVVSTDPLPANTTYVGGSLKLVNPLTGATTPLSDSPGDDVGEYDAAGRIVRVRLGSGAGAATNAGGRMACSGTGCTDDGSSRASYTFQVSLDNGAGGTTVTNLANLSYTTATTGIGATYTTNPASVDVITRADVSITKVMTPDPTTVGDETTGTITVTNNGPNTAQNVTMRDPIIDGWINDSVDAPAGVSCTVDTVITCNLGDVPVGASVVIVAHGHMTSSTTTPTLTNVAYANTSSYDPDLTNNVASDTINLIRTADLAISKTAEPTSAPAGSTISYTLSVTNHGPSDAQNVLITDTVANAAQLSLGTVTAATGGATCSAPQGGSLRCTAATLTAGASATVTVTGVLSSGLAAGASVANTATVTSGTADTNSANDTATSQVTTTAPSSDVQLTKTGPASVVAGSTVTYTIVATNLGPSDASDVVVTDRAPAGVTWTAVTSSRGSCPPPSTSITCTIGALPAGAAGQPGASATITVTGTLTSDAAAGTGVLSNTATVTSNGPTHTATATSDVTHSFDLAVAKTANRASLPAAAGRQVVYTITVSNNGPSTASGVVVSDLLPLGLDFQSATPQSGTCDTSQAGTPQPGDTDHGLLTCTLADPIPVSGTQTVTVTMVSPGDMTTGPAQSETVTVTARGDDQTKLANNTATWTLSGQPYSDLSLTKTGPATAVAGSTGVYSFAVLNTPPTPDEEQLIALAPTITDTLPAGVTFVPSGGTGSVTPAYCTAVGQDVTCALPDNINPNDTESTQFSVQFSPDLADGSSVTNTAEVHNQAANPDPNPANNTSSTTTAITANADVAVTGMTVTPRDPDSTGPGSWIDISFTLTNNGPSTARTVQFTTSINPDVGVDPSTIPGTCTLANGELVCTLTSSDLAVGQSVGVSFGAVLAGYVTPGSYGAQTHVSSATPDSDPTNNDDSATFTVGPARTDLQVAKTAIDTIDNPNGDGHQAYVAGKPFAYQITLSVPNSPGDGVADAANVVVSDTMPAGFQATLVSTTAGTCTVSGGGTSFSCQLGTIAAWPGSTEPVTVTIYGFVAVSAEGEQIPNTATATSTTDDQDGAPTSVSATASVDVIEQADLQLFKVADPGPFHAGGSIGYTLTTVNAGPSDVEDATITDTLPAGLTLDATNSPGCAVTSGDPTTGQQVSCTVGAIGVGSSASIRVVASTPPDATPGTITNTATVTSSATDPIPANNTASAAASIDQLTDVAISSSVSTTTPAAGGQITYTGYTINNGPSAAHLVTGDTTFPPGFVPGSWDVPFNTCTWNHPVPADPTTVAWQDVSYTLHCEPADPTGPFEPGVAGTSVVVMQIPGDTPAGNYSGTSTIATPTPESTTANNATAQTVAVQHVSNTAITKTLVDPNPMLAGRPATWRLTVTNAGPSVADDVVISDTVPAGMTFSSANLEGGSACPAPEIHDEDTIVKCPIASLGAGASASALVTFAINPGTGGQQLCNTALVGSGSLDPDATDNQAENCNDAAAPPATDVGVTITAQHPRLDPGQQAEFTAVVRNNGDQPATGVTITFPIPTGLTDPAGILLTASDGTNPDATCLIDDIVCTVGDLQPGQEVRYRITGTTTGPAGSILTLTGTVTHNEPDTDPANNTSQAAVIIIATPPTTPPASSSPGGTGAGTGPANNTSHAAVIIATPPTTPPASSSPGGTGAGTGSANNGSTGLPFTGTDIRTPLVLGLLALTAGLALILTGRRRPTRPNPVKTKTQRRH